MNTKPVSRTTQSERIRRMVIAAMLSAITAVLTFTPIGMIPLPPPLPSATMVHIPVLLAVLVEGPAVGLTVGLVFGLCSCIRAWETGMVGLTLFFRNPIISVLPRLLVPLAAYGLWKADGEPLEDYLDKVFFTAKSSTLMADETDMAGFEAFLARYKAALPVEKIAVTIAM